MQQQIYEALKKTLIMHFKNHINNLVRLQTSQNRDLINGILLDRNERADSFNNLAFKKH